MSWCFLSAGWMARARGSTGEPEEEPCLWRFRGFLDAEALRPIPSHSFSRILGKQVCDGLLLVVAGNKAPEKEVALLHSHRV